MILMVFLSGFSIAFLIAINFINSKETSDETRIFFSIFLIVSLILFISFSVCIIEENNKSSNNQQIEEVIDDKN